MKTYLSEKVSVACTLAVLLAVICAAAQASEGIVVFDAGDAHVQHLAQAVDVDGRLWMLVEQRVGHPATGDAGLSLWQIDSGGRRIGSRRIALPDVGPGRFALHAGYADRDLLIGFPAPDGLRILSVTDPGEKTQGFFDPAQQQAVWIGFVAGAAGSPLAVTSRGVAVFDPIRALWVSTWRPEGDRLVIDVVATGDGIGLLTARHEGEVVQLAIVKLSADGMTMHFTTTTAPAGLEALYSQLGSTDAGLNALIPLERAAPSRWRLVQADRLGNLASSENFELPQHDTTRSRFLRLEPGWALNAATPDALVQLVRLDDALRIDARGRASIGDDRFVRVRRASAVTAQNVGFIVLSMLARHPTAKRLRSEIAVMHLDRTLQ